MSPGQTRKKFLIFWEPDVLYKIFCEIYAVIFSLSVIDWYKPHQMRNSRFSIPLIRSAFDERTTKYNFQHFFRNMDQNQKVKAPLSPNADGDQFQRSL
jgi:hypothetical protein